MNLYTCAMCILTINLLFHAKHNIIMYVWLKKNSTFLLKTNFNKNIVYFKKKHLKV